MLHFGSLIAVQEGTNDGDWIKVVKGKSAGFLMDVFRVRYELAKGERTFNDN